MRRTAAVLVSLLTATAARAGMDEGRLDVLAYMTGCCTLGPLLFVFTLVIALAIYDRRKGLRRGRRIDPPPPGAG